MKNKEVHLAKKRAYYYANIEKSREISLASYYKHHEARKAGFREYSRARYRSGYRNDWKQRNLTRHRATMAAYMRNRRVDIGFKLRVNMSRRLNHALRRHQGPKARASTLKMLGCSITEFKVYLEGLFVDGMSWSNYGEWELDHILPLANYKLDDPKTLSVLSKYTNYQPLWKIDNLIKSNKE